MATVTVLCLLFHFRLFTEQALATIDNSFDDFGRALANCVAGTYRTSSARPQLHAWAMIIPDLLHAVVRELFIFLLNTAAVAWIIRYLKDVEGETLPDPIVTSTVPAASAMPSEHESQPPIETAATEAKARADAKAAEQKAHEIRMLEAKAKQRLRNDERERSLKARRAALENRPASPLSPVKFKPGNDARLLEFDAKVARKLAEDEEIERVQRDNDAQQLQESGFGLLRMQHGAVNELKIIRLKEAVGEEFDESADTVEQIPIVQAPVAALVDAQAPVSAQPAAFHPPLADPSTGSTIDQPQFPPNPAPVSSELSAPKPVIEAGDSGLERTDSEADNPEKIPETPPVKPSPYRPAVVSDHDDKEPSGPGRQAQESTSSPAGELTSPAGKKPMSSSAEELFAERELPCSGVPQLAETQEPEKLVEKWIPNLDDFPLPERRVPPTGVNSAGSARSIVGGGSILSRMRHSAGSSGGQDSSTGGGSNGTSGLSPTPTPVPAADAETLKPDGDDEEMGESAPPLDPSSDPRCTYEQSFWRRRWSKGQ